MNALFQVTSTTLYIILHKHLHGKRQIIPVLIFPSLIYNQVCNPLSARQNYAACSHICELYITK